MNIFLWLIYAGSIVVTCAAVCEQGTSTIDSYGIHKQVSSEKRWAYGIKDLQFRFSCPYVNPSSGTKSVFEWSIGWSDTKFQAATMTFNGSLCEVHEEHTNVTCWIRNGTIFSVVTLNSSHLQLDKNRLTVFDVVGNRIIFNITFFLSYCKMDGGPAYTILPPISNVTYRTNGTISCRNNKTELINVTSNKAITSTSTYCNEYAQWQGINSLECWYAPTVDLIIEDRYFNNKEIVQFECNVQNGNAIYTRVDLYIEHNPIHSRIGGSIVNVTMEPEYNQQNASCKVSYRFFEGREMRSAVSENETLDVRFPPQIDPGMVPICFTPGTQRNYSVFFYANPMLNNDSLFFQFGDENINGTITNHTRTVNGTERQEFTALFNLSSDESLKLVSSSGIMPNFNISLQVAGDCSHTTAVITTTTNKTTTTTNQMIVIAGTVGGSAFLLMISSSGLVFLIVKRKRKHGKLDSSAEKNHYNESSLSRGQSNSERQERDNPLYGTSHDLKSGSGQAGKEEVINPLYDTRTADPQSANDIYTVVNRKQKHSDPSKDVYAAVQKPNKKDEKKSTVTEDAGPSTSGLQTDSTYAVLNRKKKVPKNDKKSGQENAVFTGDLQEESTYAVVDKKKKKPGRGKSADQPSTSAPTEDATYAVVQKKDRKKPKKDDSEDDDLHGSIK